MIRKGFLLGLFLAVATPCFCWGFFAHKKINYYSVFLLPPQMLVFYKKHIDFISEHAVDPDKRRYAVPEEGPRHFIDLDEYGQYPFADLPRNWREAVEKVGEEKLREHGIVPWHVQRMQVRLKNAFSEKNFSAILKNSTEIAHYIADAHVPLHATKNYNGQLTNQKGIHGLWESRVPELLADARFDFFIGQARYIENTGDFIWERVLESALAADSVLKFEKELSKSFSTGTKYAYEKRNNVTARQYSSAYTIAYDKILRGMVERRMRQSVFAVASFWYTAWVDAGQPDLAELAGKTLSAVEIKELETLNEAWRKGRVQGRQHDDD